MSTSNSASVDQPTDARERLLSHFSAASTTTEHAQQWDALWLQDWTPWDKGFPNPALVDLLATRHQDLPPNASGKRKRALVPGCGKGYDVLLLAAFGYDAYGLEVSSKAIELCKKTEQEEAGKGTYEKQVEGGRISWLLGDFWKDEFLSSVDDPEKQGFDLIYDYTVCFPSC